MSGIVYKVSISIIVLIHIIFLDDVSDETQFMIAYELDDLNPKRTWYA